MIFNKYVCVKQHGPKDCGAACLATILKHYGRILPMSKIRDISGTDKQGTSAFGIIKAAEQLGFTARGVKGNPDSLYNEFPLPAVAHVKVDYSFLHYVVIHKITATEVIIADPAKGICKYTPEEFINIWTGVLLLLVPTSKFQKGNETNGILSRFIKILLPQKRIILRIFVLSLLITVLGMLGAFYFKYLIDEIIPGEMNDLLQTLSAGVIILILMRVILNAVRSHLLLKLSQQLDIKLLFGYYSHVLKLPLNFFENRKSGEIISRLMDASKVRDAISGAALTIMIDTLMVFIGGVLLYNQNAHLFGVTVIMVPIYALIVWLFHKSFERLNRIQMENNSAFTSYIVESIDGIETVKAYNAEEKINVETEKKFNALLHSILKLGISQNIQSSLKALVQAIGGIIILWAGTLQVLKGNLSIGQLITFNALLIYFLDPLHNLINLQSSIQTAIVAANRLGEILDLDTEKIKGQNKKSPDSLRGAIRLQGVNFRYGTRGRVLKEISMNICPGEKIALVGESGSGKTTLIKLLVEFYQCESGIIQINETNINDIELSTLREKIAYVPQDTFFFSGTIYENLCLGVNHNIDMEQVIKATEISKAHDFIKKLPLGYNTLLEENGSNLSGGQRQRLAIARAILKQPDILIMDEATSNLDTTTERAISETIYNFKGITSIIIAHRLSTIMRCDCIYVMEDGKIIDHGTHQELIQKKGVYYNLWRDQLPG